MLEINPPAGIVRNGTDLQAEGRWRDGNLIRFKDGTLQPVGGWASRSVTLGSLPRGAFSWSTNDGTRWVAFGSYDALRVMTVGGVVSDISPADLGEGALNAANAVGYGISFYGAHSYGTPRPESEVINSATTWQFDNWGENLIAVSSYDGRILEWPLTGLAAPLANAPTCLGAVVTDERFVMAFGAGGDPRNVAWSDRENNTVWAPLTTNEAGFYNIQTQGNIVAGVRAKGEVLILTTLDAHTAKYIGPPYVYRFDRVGSACGLIAPKAVAAIEGGVVWMGRNSLYLYSNGAVQALPCDVFDHVFGDLNVQQVSKIHAVANQTFGEVWFFYPSADSSECDRYFTWNYALNVWTVGEMARTTGFDRGVYNLPVMVDAAGEVFDHETGFDYGNARPWAETGPIRMGDNVMTALYLIPDERFQGDVKARFKVRMYPNSDEAEYGPYAMGEPTNLRFTGRQFRVRFEGARLSDWRVGRMRMEVKARGMR